MAAGTLDPMAAFMQGKIMVAGDMALMMQMQAIQMQAAAQAAQAPKKEEG
jgi:putative sterol carrier protein